MTAGKSVGGEAPSAPYGYCTVEVLEGKWTIIDMTQGKSVGGNAPSAGKRGHNSQALVGKRHLYDI